MTFWEFLVPGIALLHYCGKPDHGREAEIHSLLIFFVAKDISWIHLLNIAKM